MIGASDGIALSEAQVKYLRWCLDVPRSCWDAGSSTIKRLRDHGLIVRSAHYKTAMYIATEAGRQWLRRNS